MVVWGCGLGARSRAACNPQIGWGSASRAASCPPHLLPCWRTRSGPHPLLMNASHPAPHAACSSRLLQLVPEGATQDAGRPHPARLRRARHRPRRAHLCARAGCRSPHVSDGRGARGEGGAPGGGGGAAPLLHLAVPFHARSPGSFLPLLAPTPAVAGTLVRGRDVGGGGAPAVVDRQWGGRCSTLRRSTLPPLRKCLARQQMLITWQPPPALSAPGARARLRACCCLCAARSNPPTRCPAALLPCRPAGATPPKHLDGTMLGDYGFDPLRLGSKDKARARGSSQAAQGCGWGWPHCTAPARQGRWHTMAGWEGGQAGPSSHRCVLGRLCLCRPNNPFML